MSACSVCVCVACACACVRVACDSRTSILEHALYDGVAEALTQFCGPEHPAVLERASRSSSKVDKQESLGFCYP